MPTLTELTCVLDTQLTVLVLEVCSGPTHVWGATGGNNGECIHSSPRRNLFKHNGDVIARNRGDSVAAMSDSCVGRVNGSSGQAARSRLPLQNGPYGECV